MSCVGHHLVLNIFSAGQSQGHLVIVCFVCVRKQSQWSFHEAWPMGRQPELLAAWPAGCQADAARYVLLVPFGSRVSVLRDPLGSFGVVLSLEIFETLGPRWKDCHVLAVTSHSDQHCLPSITTSPIWPSLFCQVLKDIQDGWPGQPKPWEARTIQWLNCGSSQHRMRLRCVGLAVVQAPTVEKCRISCTNQPRCQTVYKLDLDWIGLRNAWKWNNTCQVKEASGCLSHTEPWTTSRKSQSRYGSSMYIYIIHYHNYIYIICIYM